MELNIPIMAPSLIRGYQAHTLQPTYYYYHHYATNNANTTELVHFDQQSRYRENNRIE